MPQQILGRWLHQPLEEAVLTLSRFVVPITNRHMVIQSNSEVGKGGLMAGNPNDPCAAKDQAGLARGER
ncbi:hypothetical protein [Williamsia soli]|uniref:hypothetical protein n=1 Tax=Williamsia soli TaxID=364929 RepID=UPI001AA00069|nr:hypothetical protein [Williamsia soli]